MLKDVGEAANDAYGHVFDLDAVEAEIERTQSIINRYGLETED